MQDTTSRLLILLFVGLLVSGGAWKAVRTLQSDPLGARAALPVGALSKAAGQAAGDLTAAHPPSALACSPQLQLSVVQFAEDVGLVLDGAKLCELHLGPALAGAALLPPSNLSSATLLHPPAAPLALLRRLLNSQQAAGPSAELAAEALQFASQLRHLALDTHQLPSPTGDFGVAAVLVHISQPEAASEAASTPVDQAHGSSPSAGSLAATPPSITALEVDGGDSLAVFVHTGSSRAAWGTARVQQAVMSEVAAAVVDWLHSLAMASGEAGGPARLGNPAAGTDADAGAGLSAACLAGASVRLGQFSSVLGALPDMPLAPEASSLAADAVHAVRSAQQALALGQAEAALRLARQAWGGAWALQHHPGFGLEPVFPAEHQLAVVLPLALPVLLVVARAVGQEVRAWKRSRQALRAARAAAAGKKEL